MQLSKLVGGPSLSWRSVSIRIRTSARILQSTHNKHKEHNPKVQQQRNLRALMHCFAPRLHPHKCLFFTFPHGSAIASFYYACACCRLASELYERFSAALCGRLYVTHSTRHETQHLLFIIYLTAEIIYLSNALCVYPKLYRFSRGLSHNIYF